VRRTEQQGQPNKAPKGRSETIALGAARKLVDMKKVIIGVVDSTGIWMTFSSLSAKSEPSDGDALTSDWWVAFALLSRGGFLFPIAPIIIGMVATLKKWLLLIDIPFALRQLVEQGYTEFRFHAGEDTRRVELRAWKGPRTKPR
jgi:hypothetical protein